MKSSIETILITSILATVFFYSCERTSENDELNENSISAQQDSPVVRQNKLVNNSVQELDKEKKQFDSPININELKESSFLTTTSGVLTHSKSEKLCMPPKEGFFRHYQLLDESNGNFNFIGQLNVFVPEGSESWRKDYQHEIFAEIELESGKVKLWDSIRVGKSEKNLRKFIGDNFNYKKGTLIYAELEEYTLSAVILGDTISKLTVGRYCKE